MNLCRCENGHFYDKEKYASCPHCVGGSASDEKLTEAFTNDVTVPIDTPQLTPGSVAPTSSPFPPVQPPYTPPTQPATFPQGAAQQFYTPPTESPFPVAGFAADQVTVGMEGVDTPTEPLDKVINGNQGTFAKETDDCTVGYFDDIFPGEGSTEKISVKPVQQQTHAVAKAATPCVGWLVALGGAHVGTDFRLKVGRNFIGRSAQMDVALTEDKSVSRERHAIVVYDPKSNTYLVQPGESSSLAYHNNTLLLTPQQLKAYDTITVGDVNLLFMPLCGEQFNWNALFEETKGKEKA